MLHPAAYLINDGPIVPALPVGKAFAYLLASNGLFKLARNRHLEARIPLARCQVAGLHPLTPLLRLSVGRLPGSLLRAALDDARREAWAAPREAMYHIAMRDTRTAELRRPPQDTSAGRVAYSGGATADIVMDIHSHHTMNAFFSSTDDRDEQGFRLYAVLGNIFTRPEIRVRVGLYGDHWEIPARLAFDHLGPCRDALGGTHAPH